MINIAINGYGRIGRNILRALYERPELRAKMQLVAINDLGSPEMNAHLTQFDTTHGRFSEAVSVDGQDMLVGTDRIRILAERDPSQLPWRNYTRLYLHSSGFALMWRKILSFNLTCLYLMR